MRKETMVAGFMLVGLLVSSAVWSGPYQDRDRAEVAKAVVESKVSLDEGLSASTHEGKPVSAKFEIEEGKLQLSVYTAEARKFFEVIVDNNTGKIAKAEAITSGEDLTAAKAQSKAMAKAKQSLRATLAKTLKSNPGFRAVNVFPALKEGHPVAQVTLVKGDQWKTVSEKLD